MFNVAQVSNKLTLVDTQVDAVDKSTHYDFSCNTAVASDEHGSIKVSSITVYEYEYNGKTYYTLFVSINSNIIAYADSAFEAAISKLVQLDAGFTEGGEQDEGLAVLEAA